MKASNLLRTVFSTFRLSLEEEIAKRTQLYPYDGPRWARKLKSIPDSYINLARKPTPIEEWNLSVVPDQFKLDIKREDLTGNLLSGNIVRKLEFLLADALAKNSTSVITCGNMQSNHCRATSIAAKQLGLGCHLLLRSPDEKADYKVSPANMLLFRIHDAECYTLPYESFHPLNGDLDARLYKLAEQLKKKGERPYVISLGGSDYLGMFGIINSFRELLNQDILSKYDDIVVASSSGGTLAGLAIANYLTGEKLRIHGVSVYNDIKYFYKHVQSAMTEYGITRVKSTKICNIIDCYKGHNANAAEADVELLVKICQESGILLDYSYTLKAVNGMFSEMKLNPNAFKGRRVLYFHTGGAFSIFDGVQLESVRRHFDNVRAWEDINDNPIDC